MLDALGKRYVVECGKSDDGLSWWRVWSDGLKEYEKRFTNQLIPSSGKVSVPFPIEFSDTNYNFYFGVTRDMNTSISAIKDLTDSRTQTGTEVLILYVSNNGVYIPSSSTYDFSVRFCGY